MEAGQGGPVAMTTATTSRFTQSRRLITTQDHNSSTLHLAFPQQYRPSPLLAIAAFLLLAAF
jgi:hypothetical protein